jgi:thioredoxin-like negative regulator of GroEL
MDSVVDHFLRTHREHLKVAKVELAERADLAKRFNVESGPTLLLLENMREVARLEGRRTLPEIKDVFEPILGIEPANTTIQLAAC